jgi:hypothetical protein
MVDDDELAGRRQAPQLAVAALVERASSDTPTR